jgi:hypothetical protein
VPNPWTQSDAWVFAAITYVADAGPVGEQTLSDVLAYADVINHAIPTEEEFVQAIGRLTATGVVSVSADSARYWPTPAGLELRRLWRHSLSGWDILLPGLRKLRAAPDARWSLPDGAYAQAVREYEKRFSDAVRRMYRPERHPR